MPLPILPKDDVLKALGKMVLYFAEVEYCLSTAIVELEYSQEGGAMAKIQKVPFQGRVDRLKNALRRADERWGFDLARDKFFTLKPIEQLPQLGIDRNNLIHAAVFSKLDLQNSRAFHFSYNFRSEYGQVIEAAALEDLADRCRHLGEWLSVLTMTVGMRKHERGIEPIFLRTVLFRRHTDVTE
jgi:hypothetical protein